VPVVRVVSESTIVTDITFERILVHRDKNIFRGVCPALYYRQLRDSRYAEEIPTDSGDEAIVNGYASFQSEGRKDVLLFSNDRDFIERATLIVSSPSTLRCRPHCHAR
jgi:hypothetical protein